MFQKRAFAKQSVCSVSATVWKIMFQKPRFPKQSVCSVSQALNNFVVPLVYALTESKSTQKYSDILHKIRDEVSNAGGIVNPKIIVSDFESGYIAAFKRHYPDSLHSGYHFHYSQALWRKVQEEGLTTAYQTDSQISDFVQSVVALAFVPTDQVVTECKSLVLDLPILHLPKLQGFIDYFLPASCDGSIISISQIPIFAGRD